MPEPDCFLPYRISAATRNFTSEGPTYTYWRPGAAARRGFKMVLFTEPSDDLCRRYLRTTECLWAISVAFVRPSVCLSVRPSRTWRIIREPKGLTCPNLEGRFPTLDATRIPVSRSNGQKSVLKAGGEILCRPNPVATLLVIIVHPRLSLAAQTEHGYQLGVRVHASPPEWAYDRRPSILSLPLCLEILSARTNIERTAATHVHAPTDWVEIAA